MPPVGSVLDIQRDGVRAIQVITGRYSDVDWERPSPCEGWSALDLAGHVLTTIENWHVLLDDSEAGATSPRFRWDEMDAYFEAALADLPAGSGPDRVETFAHRAGEYFDRVSRLDPELPFVSALSDVAAVPLTVGLFAWVGGNEWHIHAWDFAQVIDEDYQTPHARIIYEGTMAVRGLAPGDEDAWETMLHRWRPNSP